ncbi:Pentatricopeptide repeat-containing protein [Hibiscus syriacus]|uniref:Pentatricopeptide repeat-containing protein n=1 Tax=Hibiscus syriacus TaxID=106335 RepID=A0A6A3AWH6_HIBSY|nr:Pentatricopeptide repeat-containing protein [Hibiscus syriacus]
MPTYECHPDDVTYSSMIDAYGRAGNVDMAFALYDRAKPNTVIYNTLLDAMGRAKRPWQAKSIYKEMISNGFSPNWATYASLLRAYGRARYGEDALNVYKEMKDKGLELTVVLYNTLLVMCADVGLADEAAEIFEDMKNLGKFQRWRDLNDMLEAGFEPNIFVLTSLIQCYGKAQRTDDVVKTFNRVYELGITPDDRFCGCLLNVMTHTPREELVKLIDCIGKANPKLGGVVKLLVGEQNNEGAFKNEASELFNCISSDVKKAYCNCLIDLCVNLDLLESACALLGLGLSLEIYAALTALHVWINDLAKAPESGEELPPLLGINIGHGKHKYSEKGLATVIESHLKELDAPFHEAPRQGWLVSDDKNCCRVVVGVKTYT